MTRFAPDLLNRIRDAVPLSNLIGGAITWDKRKSNPSKADYWSPCPFHAEKTPSFHVDDHKGRYHCFGCKASGDHFTWLQDHDGLSFPEAVRKVADLANVDLPQQSASDAAQESRIVRLYAVLEAAERWFWGRWRAKKTEGVPEAIEYLKQRGVSGETTKTFRIGYAPKYGLMKYLHSRDFTDADLIEAGLARQNTNDGSVYEVFRNRIMFPIHDARGRVIAFGGRSLDPKAKAKYLNSPESPLYKKDRLLYNYHRARGPAQQAGDMLAVEGYLDVILLWQAGAEHTVAPCGTALTDHHVELLWRHAREPVVCFDGDAAGQAAAARTVDVAFPMLRPGQTLRFASLPDGKDPADLVSAPIDEPSLCNRNPHRGRYAFLAAIDNATAMVDMAWSKLVTENDCATPERQARFEGDVIDLLASIKDHNVRRYYSRIYERRLYPVTGVRRSLLKILHLAERRTSAPPAPSFDRFGSENGIVSPDAHSGPPTENGGEGGEPDVVSPDRSTVLEPNRDLDTNLECASVEMTDMGNASRFLKRYGHMFLWCAEIGWLAWDGKRWARAGADNALMRAVQTTIRCIGDEAVALAKSDLDTVFKPAEGNKAAVMLSDKLQAWSLASQAAGKVLCIDKLARSYLAVTKSELDADPNKLNVHNGTLHLTGKTELFYEFRDHDPADLITKLAGTHYDPDAECPQFLEFMAQMQPETDLRDYIQRHAGSCCTGDISDEKVHFWYGGGRNGKSTTMEMVAASLGEYAVTLGIESFLDNGRPKSGGDARPDLVELDAARLVRTSEPERGQKLAESLIKLATGGEPMLVRQLMKPAYHLFPQFKLVISGNNKPLVKGGDEGIWRRLKLVPWLVHIADEDVDERLKHKIKTELPGILIWMLDGWTEWHLKGLGKNTQIEDATSEYRSDSDPLNEFIRVCLEVTGDDRDQVQSSEMFKVWDAFRKANGMPEWTQTGFSRGMTEKPGMRKRRKSVWFWLGVKLVHKVSDFIDQNGNVIRREKSDE